jgi:FkbM family methyltransferase
MDVSYNIFKLYKKLIDKNYGHGIGNLPVIKQIANKIFKFFVRNTFNDVQGHKMYVDKHDTLNLAQYGYYFNERFETNLIKEKVKEGFTVLDIGAQVGYYTLIMAKLVGDKGKVIAFEPEPSNFALLKKNVEINGYGNIILVNKALSNTNTKGKIYLNPINLGDHRIFDSGDDRQSFDIECIKFDDFFSEFTDKIDFIKMDIQGSEFAVMLGMQEVLNKNSKLEIISEFSPVCITAAGFETEEYLKFMEDKGFEYFEISEKECKILKNDLSYLIYSSNPNIETNLLFIKKTY